MIQKGIFALCFLSSLSLFAQGEDFVYWEWGARAGYRQDNAKYRTFDPEGISLEDVQPFLFKESYKHVSSFQLEGFTKSHFGWFELGVDADYAWIVNGDIHSQLTLEQVLPTGAVSFVPNTFISDLSGDFWDAFGTGGVIFPSCGQRGLHVFLIAQGGYSIHGQSLKRKRPWPDQIFLGPFGFNGTISDPTSLEPHYHNRLKRTYWGPFLGGSIRLSTCSFEGNFGYTYHWLHLKLQTHVTHDLGLTTAAGSTTVILNNKVTFSSSHSKGQRGFASLAYRSPCDWKVGLRGTYFQVDSSKKTKGKLVSKTSSDDSSQRNIPVSSRWNTFSVLLEFAYDF